MAWPITYIALLHFHHQVYLRKNGKGSHDFHLFLGRRSYKMISSQTFALFCWLCPKPIKQSVTFHCTFQRWEASSLRLKLPSTEMPSNCLTQMEMEPSPCRSSKKLDCFLSSSGPVPGPGPFLFTPIHSYSFLFKLNKLDQEVMLFSLCTTTTQQTFVRL